MERLAQHRLCSRNSPIWLDELVNCQLAPSARGSRTK
jgi:hypothetical protein